MSFASAAIASDADRIPHGTASDSDVRNLLRQLISTKLREVQSFDDLPGFDPKHATLVMRRFRPAVASGIDAAFEKHPLAAPVRSQLRRIIALIPQKDMFPIDASGLVVAGFGEHEYLPALCAYQSTVHGSQRSK